MGRGIPNWERSPRGGYYPPRGGSLGHAVLAPVAKGPIDRAEWPFTRGSIEWAPGYFGFACNEIDRDISKLRGVLKWSLKNAQNRTPCFKNIININHLHAPLSALSIVSIGLSIGSDLATIGATTNASTDRLQLSIFAIDSSSVDSHRVHPHTVSY